MGVFMSLCVFVCVHVCKGVCVCVCARVPVAEVPKVQGLRALPRVAAVVGADVHRQQALQDLARPPVMMSV